MITEHFTFFGKLTLPVPRRQELSGTVKKRVRVESPADLPPGVQSTRLKSV